MIRLPRTWKGIDRAAWPSLNKIADLIERMANSQTDGSIVWNLDEGTMYVPEPQEFEAVILGGTNPYAWAKLRSDVDGVWYAMNEEEGSEIGWPEDFAVATVKAASWAGGTVTFTLDQDISVAAGEEVFVAGVQPSEYGGTYTAVTGSGDTFTAALAADPGTYVTGGAVCKASSGNDAFREGYEYNSNETVPKGKVVWLKPRYLTDGDGTDQEYKFPYCCEPVTSNTTLIETTVSRSHNSTQNNYPTNNYTAYLLNPSVNFSITGFANGVCGKVIEILNSGAGNNNITVASNSASSDSSNQYYGYGGANDVIGPRSTATYFYDCVQNKWVKKAGSGTATGAAGCDSGVKLGSTPDGDNTTYTTILELTGKNVITGYWGVTNIGPTFNLDFRATYTFQNLQTQVSTGTLTSAQQANRNLGNIAITNVGPEEYPIIGFKMEVKSNSAITGTQYRFSRGFLFC